MTLATRTSIVKFLLENGANPNVTGLNMNIGPLNWAVMYRHEEVLLVCIYIYEYTYTYVCIYMYLRIFCIPPTP
jgi:hypothetical protein